MGLCNCLRQCLARCCGTRDDYSRESDGLYMAPFGTSPHTYTVRRISSFGETIVNENGEESEIGRHASILRSCNEEKVPWTSKPAPVQPGVKHSDVLSQIEKLPPIKEAHSPKCKKSRWKKRKGEYSPKFIKDKSPTKDVHLEQFRIMGFDSNISSSQSDIFSKCHKKSISKQEGLNRDYLIVSEVAPSKSHSSPELANYDSVQNFIVPKKYHTPELKNSTSSLTKPSHMKKKNISSHSPEAERLARQYGLDLSLYTEEALSSTKICAAQKETEANIWQEEPAGILNISVQYDTLQKLLMITLESVEGLSGEGLYKEPFSTVVKLTLLSVKKISKTSKKLPASLNPSVNQLFTFIIKDLNTRALRFSVFNADWLGKNEAVGHAIFYLHDIPDEPRKMHFKLTSQSTTESTPCMAQISLGFDGIVFTVAVTKLFNMEPKYRNFKLYTKISYYSLSKKIKEKMSPVTWREEEGGDEIYLNQTASFRVDTSGKKHSYVSVSVKGSERSSGGVFRSDRTLGRLRLGPYFYLDGGKVLTPWGRAIKNKETLCYSFKMTL